MRTLFTAPGLFSPRRLGWLLAVLFPMLLLGACKKEDAYADFIAQQKELDDQAIQEWLTTNNITSYEKRPSGLYIIRRVNGTGPQVQTGKLVQVKYIGRFLNGLRFDSSYETNPQCQCFSYQVGSSGIIKGWNEALPLMRKGDEFDMLIPSNLAYGPSSYGSVPANTPLRFEMIVTDVEQ
jgi:FKBP-type peptidyl-prolyl cis-trans isomerase